MLGVSDQIKENLLKGIVFPRRMGRPEEFAMLVESIARNPLPERREHPSRRSSAIPVQIGRTGSPRRPRCASA